MPQADKFNIDKTNEVLARLAIEYVPIDQVKPNDYNPNRQSAHDFEMLCKSIATDGFTQPVVVTTDDVVVDGEHRWRACKELGYTQIAVVRTKMTPEQARIATLRHNRARGSEDAGLAGDVLRQLAEMGAIDFAQEELQLDNLEVQRMLDDMKAETNAAMNFEVTDEDLGADGEGLTDEDKERGVNTDADVLRAKERKLKAAREAEENQMYAADSRIYRLLVVLTGDQAAVVNRVLGKSKAQAVLELCKAEKARLAG